VLVLRSPAIARPSCRPWRAQLNPALRLALELGKHEAYRRSRALEGMIEAYFFTSDERFESLWQEHKPEILAAWISAHPKPRTSLGSSCRQAANARR
jgi:hypothetical protein